MEKVKIILPIHSALAPHVSASGVMSALDYAVDWTDYVNTDSSVVTARW